MSPPPLPFCSVVYINVIFIYLTSAILHQMCPWYLYQNVKGAHVRSNICFLICLRRLIKSRKVTNLIFSPHHRDLCMRNMSLVTILYNYHECARPLGFFGWVSLRKGNLQKNSMIYNIIQWQFRSCSARIKRKIDDLWLISVSSKTLYRPNNKECFFLISQGLRILI